MKEISIFTGVTADFFLDHIKPLARPAVLKGLVGDWPMLAPAGQESALLDHLEAIASPLPIPHFVCPPHHRGRFFYAPGYTSFNYTQEQAPIADFAARLRHEAQSPAPAALFAGSLAAGAFFPGFADSHRLDGFIAASQFLQSLWIGNQTLTAPHYDNVENIACVLAGRRRFTLFAPEQMPNLYIGPLDPTPAGQPISLVDIRAPDYQAFPRYAAAEAEALVAELAPGDALYIPTLWWHGVESLDAVNVMVNFWWRDVPAHFGAPMASLLHAALSLRSLPPAQRAAWKAVFDTLIFETHGPALAHLPAEAQGVLGALTRANAAHIRQLLAQNPG